MPRSRRVPTAISLLDPLLDGLESSEAVDAFLAGLTFPAMILSKRSGDVLRFAYVNAAATALTGFAAGEIFGRPYALIEGEDTDEAEALRYRDDIERTGSGYAILVNYRKDGSPYEVFLMGGRLITPSDKADLFVSFAVHLRDVDTVLPRQCLGPGEPRPN
ncbi:MAG: PAS domain S-box protein [Pseudomonadota bacterium]